MSSMVNVDFDGILKKIAKALYKDSEIDDLGVELGFEPSDVRRYINANAQQGGTHMGTLDMLRTWRKGQIASTEKAELRSALLRAGCVNLADQYLSSSNPGQQQETATGPSSATMSAPTNTSRMDRIVTDGELDKLAGCLPTDYYNRVAIKLGVSYAEYSNIKRQNAAALRDANFEMLMNWRRKKDGGKVRDLDKALDDAGCGGLSYKDE
eukprot:XP_011673168.1 PREDICTED: uncharacterized protein LOC105442601 isoform X2 [Strongylocentrotus purpuratus]